MRREDLDAVMLKALRRAEDRDAVAVIVGLVSLLCMVAVLEGCVKDGPAAVEAIEKEGGR